MFVSGVDFFQQSVSLHLQLFDDFLLCDNLIVGFGEQNAEFFRFAHVFARETFEPLDFII